MASYDYDLGILGGGSAGLTVASGAAQLGAKTLLVEKEPRLGGDCLHYGCVPSKTLIHSARVYHRLKHAPDWGLPPVEAPPVDFREIRRRIQQVISRIQEHDSEERFCSLGAEVRFGNASFVDGHVLEVDGDRVSAAKWVIATGSSPAAPPVPGLDQTPYLTNKEIFYLDSLPRSLIILGAGPIACEMAQAFSRLGSRVTVIQRSGQILSKEDKDLADLVMQRLIREGVTIHLKAKVSRVRDRGGAREVVFSDAEGREQTASASALLVALGRRANLDGLNLEAAGVAHSPKGLELDGRLRTSRPHIYGAGDVTGTQQFTHAAGYEGGIVLANAVFRLPRKVDYTWLPRCIYTEPELASLGMSQAEAEKAGIDHRVWVEEFKDNDRSLAEGNQEGLIKLLVDKNEKPLGVQILGPRAGDLLAEWVAVAGGKVRLSTLAAAVHPYPTLAEINKRVAGDLMAEKLFSNTMKKGLKFFFHLRGRACRPADGPPAVGPTDQS